MKRLFTLLMMVSLVCVAFAQPPIKTLYLMGAAPPAGGDLLMVPILESLGLDVTAEALTADSPTADYDLIFFSESPPSGSDGWAHYGTAPLPIVSLKVHSNKSASLNWVPDGEAGTGGVDYDNGKDSVLKVVAAGHDILTGITDTDIQVLDNADASKALVGWVNMDASGVTPICVSTTDGIDGQSIVAIDDGTALNSTNTLASRAVILAFHQESWDFLNDNAKTLIINACYWAVKRDIPGEGGGDAISDYAAVETSIFPNPSTGVVNLEFAQSIKNLSAKVLSMDGRVVFSQQLAASQTAQLDLSDLNAGVYFIHFEGTDVSYTEKLILK